MVWLASCRDSEVRSELTACSTLVYHYSLFPTRYKLWNPVAHQYAWRYPEYMNWTNLSYRERYFDTVSFIDEYVGNNASKLSIGFVDPDTVGFNTSAWPEQQIETIVVGHIHIGGIYTMQSSINLKTLICAPSTSQITARRLLITLLILCTKFVAWTMVTGSCVPVSGYLGPTTVLLPKKSLMILLSIVTSR